VSRLGVTCALLGWLGLALVLSEVPFLRRASLVSRLRPYAPSRPPVAEPARPLDAALLHLLVPTAAFGEQAARILGSSESARTRLTRIHAGTDVTEFRVRQSAWAIGGLLLGALFAAALHTSPPVAAVLVLAGPVAAFALIEHLLTERSRAWQADLTAELPIVAEQIGMLLSSGWSLGQALARVAHRGQGACAADLGRVLGRISHGLAEDEALREWAALARVDGVDRLVAVLALHRETTELGRMVGDEAHALRRDAHRRLLEAIERRSQQVWIPVTVAALVPGVILLAVPFIEALRLFTAP